ncbi:MAG: peptidylprolyl isomerase [Bacteroidales bacterium]|jgi:cyclophilin family peptidyl-prolyl cis-trans isomerase
MLKKLNYLLIALLLLPLMATAKTPKFYVVNIQTTAGDIVVRLYNETPLHRDNFVKLCNTKNYDNVLFHRVIKEFMVQSGDPDSKAHEPGKLYGEGDLGYRLPAEILPELFHKKGVLAAAREGDKENPERKSSASQFYIVVGKKLTDQDLDKVELRISKSNKTENFKFTPERREFYKTYGGTPHLDLQYTIFGEVVTGQELADKISQVETDKNDRPVKDIWIISTKVSLLKERKIKKLL